MKPKDSNIIINRLKSVKYASKGLVHLIRTENAIKTQIAISIIMTFAGFYFQLTTVEWLAQILCIGLIIVAEGINTAIEHIVDYIQPNFDKKIGLIKDIAAGAVMFAALTAIVVGLIIYTPKIVFLING